MLRLSKTGLTYCPMHPIQNGGRHGMWDQSRMARVVLSRLVFCVPTFPLCFLQGTKPLQISRFWCLYVGDASVSIQVRYGRHVSTGLVRNMHISCKVLGGRFGVCLGIKGRSKKLAESKNLFGSFAFCWGGSGTKEPISMSSEPSVSR